MKEGMYDNTATMRRELWQRINGEVLLAISWSMQLVMVNSADADGIAAWGSFPDLPAALELGTNDTPKHPFTTDPNDPDLGHGTDTEKVGQNKKYLVLSEEERAQGFVRPVRRAYKHVGIRPKYPTRPLTQEEEKEHEGMGYTAYEEYPEEMAPLVGKFWTAAELNSGCGYETRMGLALCETYARNPKFYGSTYCTNCMKHLRVDEFVWVEDGQVVGS